MNAYVGPSSLLLMGIALFVFSARLPSYHDPNWRQPFLNAGGPGTNYDSLSTAWYAAKAKAQTPRNQLMDLGAGLAGLGTSIALLFALRRVRSWRDFLHLKSPSSRSGFVVLAALIWLSFIPAEWLWLDYTARREDYPWWADSIAIPMSEAQTFGLFWLPVIVLGALIAVRRAQLPTKLWARPVIGRSYLVAPLLIIAAVGSLGVIVSGIVAAPFIVPSAIFTLYLLLSGRAAAVQNGAG